MLEDVNTAVSWVLRHAARHGGDASAVTLVGQSAGGQLALMALLSQVRGRGLAGAGTLLQAAMGESGQVSGSATCCPPLRAPPCPPSLPQAAQAATGRPSPVGAAPAWHPLDLHAFVGVSGAYDLEGLAAHLHRWVVPAAAGRGARCRRAFHTLHCLNRLAARRC
jgi:prenylcysteine alpha-carboxyl methylesterase